MARGESEITACLHRSAHHADDRFKSSVSTLNAYRLQAKRKKEEAEKKKTDDLEEPRPLVAHSGAWVPHRPSVLLRVQECIMLSFRA